MWSMLVIAFEGSATASRAVGNCCSGRCRKPDWPLKRAQGGSRENLGCANPLLFGDFEPSAAMVHGGFGVK